MRKFTQLGSPLLLLLVCLVGAASFLYPFFLPALAGVGVEPVRGGVEIPILFTGLGIGCLALILLMLQDGLAGGDRGISKMIALLGILVALDATLRLVPTLLGASAIFLLIILAGYSFGAQFGFLMGALTLLVSALITGGLGPWLPYQMLGAGWVGMTAGLLPRTGETGGRSQIVMLALFGGLWGIFYGAILNLMEWPFAAPGLQQEAGLYWTPGMDLMSTLSAYGRYYLATSLVYDSFRAIANVILVLALGRPLLRLFERYRSRFIWQPWEHYQTAEVIDSPVAE